jgi:Glycosyl transferase family group 2
MIGALITFAHWFTGGVALLPVLFTLLDLSPAQLQRKAKVFPIRDDAPAIDDFAVLVPIYGNTSYLQNVGYLRQYGSRVTLCTTDRENQEFYDSLEAIAAEEGFGVFRAPFPKVKPSANGKRNTGGTIRDRVIREALLEVQAEYVVCIDADTETDTPINALVNSFAETGLDLASIRVIAQNSNTMIARFQQHEYRIAMRVRRYIPWLISGACHIAKTKVHRQIMQRHSLFFQGNDVELGLIGEASGYKVGHMLYDVPTIVPDTFQAWWRQRCAWSGGQFRLAIVNVAYSLRLPAFFFYMSLVVTVGAPLRWLSLLTPTRGLFFAGILYFSLTLLANRKHINLELIIYPLYAMIGSMIHAPLGLWYYVKMSRKDDNWGVIRHRSMRETLAVRKTFVRIGSAVSSQSLYLVLSISSIVFAVIAVIDATPSIAAGFR